MNIIIIEDEMKTAKSLENIILGLRPEAKITGRFQSVESSIKALSAGNKPDLIFMDVQLSDGLCFDIFQAVEITSPVIFCTAFDEYSLEAFKNNGVDYVLKPFSKEDIREALIKVDGLRNFFQQRSMPDINELLLKLSPTAAKTSFLVFRNQKYSTVQVENIAFFYIRYDDTVLVCFDKESYSVNKSLDQIAGAVSPKQFFRINRQYLVNFKAIKEVEHYFMRKLHVKLVVETPEKLLVNKEKAHGFLSWMEER